MEDDKGTGFFLLGGGKGRGNWPLVSSAPSSNDIWVEP